MNTTLGATFGFAFAESQSVSRSWHNQHWRCYQHPTSTKTSRFTWITAVRWSQIRNLRAKNLFIIQLLVLLFPVGSGPDTQSQVFGQHIWLRQQPSLQWKVTKKNTHAPREREMQTSRKISHSHLVEIWGTDVSLAAKMALRNPWSLLRFFSSGLQTWKCFAISFNAIAPTDFLFYESITEHQFPSLIRRGSNCTLRLLKFFFRPAVVKLNGSKHWCTFLSMNTEAKGHSTTVLMSEQLQRSGEDSNSRFGMRTKQTDWRMPWTFFAFVFFNFAAQARIRVWRIRVRTITHTQHALTDSAHQLFSRKLGIAFHWCAAKLMLIHHVHPYIWWSHFGQKGAREYGSDYGTCLWVLRMRCHRNCGKTCTCVWDAVVHHPWW